MVFRTLAVTVAGFLLLTGCSMFTAWKSIPPPGGCDSCHSLPVNNNWKVAYVAPVLTSEAEQHPYFQSERYTVTRTDRPGSRADALKLEDQRCFDCHRLPSPAHKERTGRYHH
ncbi:MAG TPA: cytochrome C [Geobacterales bacterium]|nr:cytochrome C [Geobacterales bacterium]